MERKDALTAALVSAALIGWVTFKNLTDSDTRPVPTNYPALTTSALVPPTLSSERAEAVEQFRELQSLFSRWLKPDWNTLDSIDLATMSDDELVNFLQTHRLQNDQSKISWVDISSGPFVYDVDITYNPSHQVSEVILQTDLAESHDLRLKSLFDPNRPQSRRVTDLLETAFGTKKEEDNSFGSGGLIFKTEPDQPGWKIIQNGAKIEGVRLQSVIGDETVELVFKQTGETTLTVSQALDVVTQPVQVPILGHKLRAE